MTAFPADPLKKSRHRRAGKAAGKVATINTFSCKLPLFNKQAVCRSTALAKYFQLTSWVVRGWELLAHAHLHFKCQSSLAVSVAKDSRRGAVQTSLPQTKLGTELAILLLNDGYLFIYVFFLPARLFFHPVSSFLLTFNFPLVLAGFWILALPFCPHPATRGQSELQFCPEYTRLRLSELSNARAHR